MSKFPIMQAGELQGAGQRDEGIWAMWLLEHQATAERAGCEFPASQFPICNSDLCRSQTTDYRYRHISMCVCLMLLIPICI